MSAADAFLDLVPEKENGASHSVSPAVHSIVSHLPQSVELLERLLEDSPYDGEIYQLAIQQFQSLDDLANVRKFRCLYSRYCVLEEDFWLQWIEDEQALIPPGFQIEDECEKFEAFLRESVASFNVLRDANEKDATYVVNSVNMDTQMDKRADKIKDVSELLSAIQKTDGNVDVLQSLPLDDYRSILPVMQLMRPPSILKKPYPPFDNGALSVKAMCLLHELAIYCCSTVELWLHYIQFLIDHTRMIAGGNQLVRNAFERAIGCLGLHALDAPILWMAYRNFEATPVEAEVKETKGERVERIRELFYRQLKLPLGGLQDLLDEYRVWEEELPEESKVSFQKGEECHQIGHNEWEKRKIFEIRAQNEMDDLGDINGLNTLWNDYLSFEWSTKDPARICITYRRALEDLGSIREDLWLSFTDYLIDTLHDPGAAQSVYFNAVKHFPSCSKLWVNYFLSKTEAIGTLEDFYEMLFAALNGCENDVSDSIDIYLVCADCLARRTEKNTTNLRDGVEVDWSPVRGVFQLAEKYAEDTNAEDQLLKKIWNHWSRFETGKKDLAIFLKVCEKMVARFGTLYEVWMNYIHFTKQLLGDTEHVEVYNCLSALFQRALKSVEDYPLALKQDWIQFEYEMGSAHSIRLARKAVAANELFSGTFSHRNKLASGSRPKGTMSISSESSNNNSESDLYQNDLVKDTRKEIVCLSSIRNRREKRRRKGDVDHETSSEASSDSGGHTYKKSRPPLYPMNRECTELSHSPLTVTPYNRTETSRPLHLPPITAHNPPHVSPNSTSPASVTSSRSRSPSPLRISPRSRSPSPSNSLPVVASTLLEVERLTRATWDGHESVDPSLVPRVAPENPDSPLHRPILSAAANKHSAPLSLFTSGENQVPFSDMPPPPYTPRRQRTAALADATNMEKAAKHNTTAERFSSTNETIDTVQSESMNFDWLCNDRTDKGTGNEVAQPHIGSHHLQRPLAMGAPSDGYGEYLGSHAESSTAWISNIDESVTEKELTDIFKHNEGFKEVRLVMDRKKKSKGFAYVEFASPEDASAAVAKMNGFRINEREMKALISRPTKALYEPTTAFISNLSLRSTEESIQDAIVNAGFKNVKEIRLRTGEGEKSMGYGYVEFNDSTSLKEFLFLDKQLEIDGAPVSIAPSIPMKGKNQSKAPVSKTTKKLENTQRDMPTPDPVTIHVKNLAFSVDEEHLKKHFEVIGAVETVTVCRYPDGKSRGFGFVKFKSENDCFGALMLNGSNINDRSIVVSRSTREITTPKATKREDDSEKLGNNISKAVVNSKRRKGSRINLSTHHSSRGEEMDTEMDGLSPGDERALVKEGTVALEKMMESAPKSNDEFRKLFLGGKI